MLSQSARGLFHKLLEKALGGLKTSENLYYSDVGNNDRVVIQELIKNIAQVNQLETSTQRDFKGNLNSFLTSGDICCPLIIFANSLNPDRARQSVGSKLHLIR